MWPVIARRGKRRRGVGDTGEREATIARVPTPLTQRLLFAMNLDFRGPFSLPPLPFHSRLCFHVIIPSPNHQRSKYQSRHYPSPTTDSPQARPFPGKLLQSRRRSRVSHDHCPSTSQTHRHASNHSRRSSRHQHHAIDVCNTRRRVKGKRLSANGLNLGQW